MATRDGSGMKVWWGGRHRAVVKRLNFHSAYSFTDFPRFPFSSARTMPNRSLTRWILPKDGKDFSPNTITNAISPILKINRHSRLLISSRDFPENCKFVQHRVVKIRLFSSIYVYSVQVFSEWEREIWLSMIQGNCICAK